MPSPPTRVCVIGAGACGLTATKTLLEHGFNVDCFEQQDDVGGNWYFGSPHSNMYESATMISSKRMTEFSDFRMPREFPHYPSHRQALVYLRAYADHFDLRPHIHFELPVHCVEPEADGKWRVTLHDGSSTAYDGVIVAAGHHTISRMPPVAKEFTGDVLHSRDYRTPEAFKNRRVLVVGAGNSGCDIAAELARHSRFTAISLRRGYHFLPKFLCGAPIDRCGASMAKYRLPWFAYRAITSAFLRIAVGPLSHYGLPNPSDRLFESHPIVNSQLLHEIGHGRVAVRPAIDSIADQSVTFADGTSDEFDVLLCATGYDVRWPFLSEDLFAVGDTDQVDLQIFPRNHEGLFFVGLIQPNGGIWALADLQAQLVAKYLHAKQQANNADVSNGRLAVMTKRIRNTKKQDLTGGLRYSESSRHEFEVEYFAYRRTLQELLSESH